MAAIWATSLPLTHTFTLFRLSVIYGMWHWLLLSIQLHQFIYKLEKHGELCSKALQESCQQQRQKVFRYHISFVSNKILSFNYFYIEVFFGILYYWFLVMGRYCRYNMMKSVCLHNYYFVLFVNCRFPKNAGQKRKWGETCGRNQNWIPTKYSRTITTTCLRLGWKECHSNRDYIQRYFLKNWFFWGIVNLDLYSVNNYCIWRSLFVAIKCWYYLQLLLLFLRFF